MKTAGDVLSAIFDENFVKKAKTYSNLFGCWAEITAKNEIPAAAEHYRIKSLEKGILLIEMDHPGWKQIIQTKQTELLNDFRTSFPELEIKRISLTLSKSQK
jgi:predicted nucleic acid-binding Zn ribbon protein